MTTPPRQPPRADIADRPRWVADSAGLTADLPAKTNQPRPRPAAYRYADLGSGQDLRWRQLMNRGPEVEPPHH